MFDSWMHPGESTTLFYSLGMHNSRKQTSNVAMLVTDSESSKRYPIAAAIGCPSMYRGEPLPPWFR